MNNPSNSYVRTTSATLPPRATTRAMARKAYEATTSRGLVNAWDDLPEANRDRYVKFAYELLRQGHHVENAFPKITPGEVRVGDSIHVSMDQKGVSSTYSLTVGQIDTSREYIRWSFKAEGPGNGVIFSLTSVDRLDIYLIHRPAPTLDPGTLLRDVTHDGTAFPFGIVQDDNHVKLISRSGFIHTKPRNVSELDSYTVDPEAAK